MRITLDWPSAKLSPNARGHWADKAKATKAAKHDAWGLAKDAMSKAGVLPGRMAGPIAVEIVFYPPTTARHDVDNLQARMKAALDGIALALGVDDVHFRPVSRIERIKPGGYAVVTLTPATVEIPMRGVVS